MRKVFCIGLRKTATTSLEKALEVLGYRVKNDEKASDRNEAKKMAVEYLKEYDAMNDFPWAVLYRWLDETYPGSK